MLRGVKNFDISAQPQQLASFLIAQTNQPTKVFNNSSRHRSGAVEPFVERDAIVVTKLSGDDFPADLRASTARPRDMSGKITVEFGEECLAWKRTLSGHKDSTSILATKPSTFVVEYITRLQGSGWRHRSAPAFTDRRGWLISTALGGCRTQRR